MLSGHSVEGRFPFLDYRVAEFAATPARLAASAGPRGEARASARAARRTCPRSIAARTKQPYRAPIGEVFAGARRARLRATSCCSPRRLEAAGLLDPARGRPPRRASSRLDGARVSETDEMALVGSISLMLLHERLVDRPELAAAAGADARGRRSREVGGREARVPEPA